MAIFDPYPYTVMAKTWITGDDYELFKHDEFFQQLSNTYSARYDEYLFDVALPEGDWV